MSEILPPTPVEGVDIGAGAGAAAGAAGAGAGADAGAGFTGAEVKPSIIQVFL